MVLTVEQHLQVATVYDKAAADKMRVPPQQRAAFARKAKSFRTLARIRAKKEAATVTAPKDKLPHETRAEAVSQEQDPAGGGWMPKAKYQTLAERLRRARAAAG